LGDERHFQALHEVDKVDIALAVRDAGALVVAAAVGGAKQPDGDGVLLGPILCLVALNICRTGLFDGLAADLSLAIRDTAALLSDRPDPPPPED